MDKRVELQKLLASLMAIEFSLDPYGDHWGIDDLLERNIEYDEQAEDCKFYMNLKLIKLLNEGYTEDEILEMINDISVEGMESLSADKQKYVIDETKKLVMKRKEILNYE